MVGPVFYQELLLGGRRSQLYWLRWVYAAWLVAQLAFLALIHWTTSYTWRAGRFSGDSDATILADFAVNYVGIFLVQHFVLLVLVIPALVAGAITDEKARGTLQYLLTANLRPGEIILGKFLGRSFQVLLLALPGLPLVGFFGVYAGLNPGWLLAFLLTTILLVAGTAAASLLASVWCRHTRDAVLSLYTIAVAGWIAVHLLPAGGPIDFLGALNPLAPLSLEEPNRGLLKSVLLWTTLTVACLVLCTWRLRPAYVRQLEALGKKKTRWWRLQRPPVQGDPIRWKERQVEGIAPTEMLRRLPRWLGFVLVIAATLSFSGRALLKHLPPEMEPEAFWTMVRSADVEGLQEVLFDFGRGAADEFYWQGIWVMLLASLVVGIRCSGAVTGEREQRTWEALLLTPLETRQLVRGKLWGIIGACLPYLFVYALVALPLALVAGMGALFWTVLWLGVTLLALGYAGAAGLWCSVQSRSSWRSLLATLAYCYLGGMVLFIPALFAAGILFMVLTLLATLVGGGLMPFLANSRDLFPVAMCLALGTAFLVMTQQLISGAEKRIGALERTKHWTFEPFYRRIRRVPLGSRGRIS